MVKKVKKVEDLYSDRTLYSSEYMFSPPSERLSHTLRFELTSGCDWGAYTFCEGYDSVPFQVKDIDEYRAHVDEVWRKIHEGSNRFERTLGISLADKLTRTFIGGGNALAVPFPLLKEAIRYTSDKFAEQNLGYTPGKVSPYSSNNVPERVSIYGRTSSIN